MATIIQAEDATYQQRYKDAYGSLKWDLAMLGNIRCVACGGFGHTIKDCPTRKKLAALGCNGGIGAKIMRRARDSHFTAVTS